MEYIMALRNPLRRILGRESANDDVEIIEPNEALDLRRQPAAPDPAHIAQPRGTLAMRQQLAPQQQAAQGQTDVTTIRVPNQVPQYLAEADRPQLIQPPGICSFRWNRQSYEGKLCLMAKHAASNGTFRGEALDEPGMQHLVQSATAALEESYSNCRVIAELRDKLTRFRHRESEASHDVETALERLNSLPIVEDALTSLDSEIQQQWTARALASQAREDAANRCRAAHMAIQTTNEELGQVNVLVAHQLEQQAVSMVELFHIYLSAFNHARIDSGLATLSPLPMSLAEDMTVNAITRRNQLIQRINAAS